MAKKIADNKIMELLSWAYDKTINGVPGVDTADKIAEDYMKGHGDCNEKANSLIRWQMVKAGTSGFITGLGGLLTLPVALPANIASVTYVQVRMIAAIAIMGGYDVRDDRVKTLVLLCLTGSAAVDVLKDIGITVGKKLTTEAINKISGKTLTVINQKVGFRLVTKFGEKGTINLGKAVPIFGGILGGTIDAASTKIIGNIARDTFCSK